MKYIIWLILFALPITAQNNWQVVREATIGNTAGQGFFININRGWLFSEISGDEHKGGIYHTSDGGINWSIQRDTSKTSPTINDIYFLDTNHGWACGDDGLVLYTTDGGNTWIQSTNASTNENLEGINFVNNNIGYACGSNGVIIQTQDGGITWIAQNTPTFSDLKDIEFFDVNNGFAVFGTNVTSVLWTNSAGYLWSIANFTKPPGQISVKMYDCEAVRGTNHAWMSGFHGNIFHSTNKGQNWTHVKAIYGSDNKRANSIGFINANVGFVAVEDGMVFRTTDGGTNWDSVSIGTEERVKNVYTFNSDSVVAIAEGHQVRISTDGGDTWTPMIEWPRLNYIAIGLADSLKITLSTFSGDMTYSNDGGNTFSYPGNVNSVTTSGIQTIEFYSPTYGLYGGDKGQIAKSIDGGASWYKTNVTGINELKRIQSIFIYNQNIAWASSGLGLNGRIYKSVDSGENWNEVADLEMVIYDIYFLDNLTGYAVGNNGKIYKCTDGNTVWNEIDSVGDNRLHAIEFIDDSTGFVVGYDGIVGKTTDGGNTWDVFDTLGYDTSGTDELYDIKFINSTEGWIAVGNGKGYNGAFYYTNDGGNNWEKFESQNGRRVNKLSFLSPSIGWAAGSHGTIFKYIGLSGVNDIDSEYPNSFYLHQNYPNPFNPGTNIEYQLNISGNAELALYNIKGQRIRTLAKEYQKTGLYKYYWDGTNDSGNAVSTGTYFFQLKINNEVHAKRMILLK